MERPARGRKVVPSRERGDKQWHEATLDRGLAELVTKMRERNWAALEDAYERAVEQMGSLVGRPLLRKVIRA